jgi:mono/diheme cytochrome c family protein
VKTGRPLLHLLLGAGLGGAMILAGCVSRPGVSNETPPASSFDPAAVTTGAQLAAIGNCMVCHTAEGGHPYAGGRPLKTPFGVIHATNITPDPETGIGRWSEAAFFRAMREGVDRDGRHLYPAFPYDHYTKLTDEDIRAIYAFLMTREPVRAATPPNQLPFPFNIRSLIAVWKRLYFEPGVYAPDPARNAEWNRGAYLVQGLGHCGACHTPRNALGAEKKDAYLAGGEVEGWHGPALTAASPAPVPWTADQLYQYLRTGLDDLHAIAAGPMAPVVRSLATVPERDLRAIAVYLAGFAGEPAPERRQKGQDAIERAGREMAAYPLPNRAVDEAARQGDRTYLNGLSIYAGACAACHDQGRQPASGAALPLALGTAMTVPTSANLIRIIVEGIVPPDGDAGRFMPGFADELSDEQLKDLVGYIRVYFGRAPAWHDVEDQLKKIRREKDR